MIKIYFLFLYTRLSSFHSNSQLDSKFDKYLINYKINNKDNYAEMHYSTRLIILKLVMGRNMREGTMMVDEDELAPVESPGRARSINGKPPYSFGGLNSETHDAATKNLNVSSFCSVLLHLPWN
jgi:hypothetical protein